MAGFKKALKMVEAEFKDRLAWITKSWMPARSIVKAAIDARKESDDQGRLIVFASSGLPWKEHMFELEEENGIVGQILYVVYKNKETDWRIQVQPYCIKYSETS